jgi:acetyl-CoA C-acetyltransferase
VTDLTTPVEEGRSPFDLIAQAGRLALADAGGNGLARAIDAVAMLRLFADTSHRFATKLGSSTNPPKSVADRLGLWPARNIYTWNGGNMTPERYARCTDVMRVSCHSDRHGSPLGYAAGYRRP